MSNNGKGQIPFSVKEGVPIIGQPLTVITWFPTVSITCNCEGKQALLLVGIGNMSVCPKCRRGYQLFGVTMLDVRKHEKAPHFDINIVLHGDEEPGDGEERKPS